jgi:hypothetical protein
VYSDVLNVTFSVFFDCAIFYVVSDCKFFVQFFLIVLFAQLLSSYTEPSTAP